MALRALMAVELVRHHNGRAVLDGLHLTAAPGERIGIIGENGIGKSTLLRLLAGVDEPDSGSVDRPDDIAYLAQELPYEPSATIADVVDAALVESRTLLADLDALGARLSRHPDDEDALARYGELLERAQDHDAWDAGRRAELVLAGLGLAGLRTSRSLAEISGGQRERLGLATVLIRRPSAVLLDEPTNHLDDAAAEFLSEQLRTVPGVVVLVSHDRTFLDSVCTHLVDLDPGPDGPTRYGGNYTDYLVAREAARDRWQKRFEDEQAELADLRAAVATTSRQVAHNRAPRDNEKMGAGHTAGRVQNQISRRVRDAQRRLGELERTQVRKPPQPLRFRAPATPRDAAEGVLLDLRDVDLPGRLHLDRLELSAGEHLLVTGANGSGKSTLLGLIAARLTTPDAERQTRQRIGFLPQDTVFRRPDRSAQQTYRDALGEASADAVPLRSLGLLAPRDLAVPVGQLSVGQRRRLGLAIVLADPPDLLLLDEPTNHLSPTLAEELQDAIDDSTAAVICASHDRWLRQRWKGTRFHLGEG